MNYQIIFKQTLPLFALLFLSLGCDPADVEDDMVLPPVNPTIEICELNENTVLENINDGVDYLITCNLRLTDDIIIDIAPGVVIEIQHGLEITVKNQAAIRAIGTAEEPIILRGHNNNNTPSWKGLLLYTSNPNMTLDYVTVADAGTEAPCCGTTWEPACLMFVGGVAAITNTTCTNSAGSGLFVDNEVSGPDILAFSNNHFTNNRMYGLYITPGNLSDLSELSATCTFSDNDMPYIGVGFSLHIISDMVLHPAPLTYHFLHSPKLSGTSHIKAGVSMLMAPGTVIGTNLTSDHSLQIEGTEEQPVIMKGELETLKSWGGVHINSDSPLNKINHLEIHHAGHLDHSSAIYLNYNGRLDIRNTHIHHAECGIYTWNDVPNLTTENITFTDVTHEFCN